MWVNGHSHMPGPLSRMQMSHEVHVLAGQPYGPGNHDGIKYCRHLQEATHIRLLCTQRWQSKALFKGAAPVEVCHLLHAKVVSCLGGPLQLFGSLADPL